MKTFLTDRIIFIVELRIIEDKKDRVFSNDIFFQMEDKIIKFVEEHMKEWLNKMILYFQRNKELFPKQN